MTAETDNSKRTARLRRERPELFCTEGMFDVRPASEWAEQSNDLDEPPRPPRRLLGALWREGEVAVMFGETGIGKSAFAIQIAESIARGSALHSFGKPPRQAVAYLDLGMSSPAFAARYSARAGSMRKPAVYRFPRALTRIAFNGDATVPGDFAGDRQRFFLHSVGLALGQLDAKVLVIDDLVRYGPGAISRAGALRVMRSLRLMAEASSMSILVLANWPARRANVPAAVGGSGPEAVIAQLADSVFCLARTTFGTDTVYLKHLKSSSNVIADPLEVEILRLRRARSFKELTYSSTWLMQNALKGPTSPNSATNRASDPEHPLLVPGYTSPPPHSGPDPRSSVLDYPSSARAAPYLGFQHLGVAPEEDATTDYRGEIARLFRRERIRRLAAQGLRASEIEKLVGRDRPKQLKSSSEELYDGMIDGRYHRYLFGS